MDKNFAGFLYRAKKANFAETATQDAPDGTYEFRFSEGDLEYTDACLGTVILSGKEVVRQNGVPVWSMNYISRVVSDDFSAKFLAEALAKIPEDLPYRGKQSYENGGYSYVCTVRGDLDWFYGYEEIFKDGEKVYECAFHGGAVE